MKRKPWEAEIELRGQARANNLCVWYWSVDRIGGAIEVHAESVKPVKTRRSARRAARRTMKRLGLVEKEK